MTDLQQENNQPPGIPFDDSSCGGCPQKDQCREVWSLENHGPLNSTGLILASVMVFLLPLTTAILAGALAQHWLAESNPFSAWLLAAAAVGLFVGGLIAWLAMPFIRKRFNATPAQEYHCRN